MVIRASRLFVGLRVGAIAVVLPLLLLTATPVAAHTPQPITTVSHSHQRVGITWHTAARGMILVALHVQPAAVFAAPNPFGFCRNDRAYIIGFSLPGGFDEGVPFNWGDVRGQILYLWCPSWVTYYPGGVNFAMLIVTNTSSNCEVFSFGAPSSGWYDLMHWQLLNAYTGMQLLTANGRTLATAPPRPRTQTLCPGQSLQAFSGVADGREPYLALAVFAVGIPAQHAGWVDYMVTPYPR